MDYFHGEGGGVCTYGEGGTSRRLQSLPNKIIEWGANARGGGLVRKGQGF